jgi:TusA-related sulfurtransferase
MKTHEIDIRGQVCPSSMLLALREINRQHKALLAGHLRIMILTDNRDATGTVPDAVRNMGLDADVEKVDGYYRITIKKQNDSNL